MAKSQERFETMSDEGTKVLHLKLPYSKPEPDQGQEREADEITTLNLLTYMINATYPELEGQTRRIYGRLQIKLEKAVDEKLSEVSLETAEAEFLKKVVGAKTPSKWSKFVMVLEDELLTL